MCNSNCTGCKGNVYRKFPKRDIPQRDIAIVGDIPTVSQAMQGKALNGGAIGVLEEAMKQYKLPITEGKVWRTTAIKCCYPKRKGKPIPAEIIRNCHAEIIEELQQVKPKLVIVLGKTATQALFGDVKLKITSYEGTVRELAALPGAKIMPMKHPALFLRSPGEYKNFQLNVSLAGKLFAGGQMHDVGEVAWQVLDTEEKCDKALVFLKRYQEFGADIETTGLDYRYAEFCVLGIAFDDNKAFVIPREMRHRCQDFFNVLRDKTWTWHHGKYDDKVMWRRGLGDIPHNSDTIYQHYTLNEQPPHDLGQLTKLFLQAPDYKWKMNQNFKAVTLETYDSFFEALCERVAVDSCYTLQLKKKFAGLIEKDVTLQKLYDDFLIPLGPFLSRVERNGLLVNSEYLEGMDTVYEERLVGINREIENMAQPYWDPELYKAESGAKSAPPKFNPSSPKQVAWMVYDRLQLKPRIRKGKGTGKEILASIEPQHPLVEKILEFRKVKKEKSTYVVGLLKRRDEDGRVRSNFGVHTTATGRLSSKEPNVQNIPSYFGVGNVRRAFLAPKGHVVMEVDYSGAELRWLACLSKCPVLTKIFVEGLNLHDETSKMLFGENFTKQDRMRAKACNFGIMYGREAKSFVDEFDISMQEAQKLVQDWLDAYPGARDFLYKVAQAVVDGSYLETPFGRRRRFGLVSDQSLHALQNEARNFPIQSSSSDTLLKVCMNEEDYLWEKWKVKIVNLVHDSVLLYAPEDPETIQAVSQYMSEKMASAPKEFFGYEVPFNCDTDIGYTWGDLVAYDYKEQTVEVKKDSVPFSEWQQEEKAKWVPEYDKLWYKQCRPLSV